jgi:hypothetical protein
VLETPLRKPPFGILRERDWGTALKGMWNCKEGDECGWMRIVPNDSSGYYRCWNNMFPCQGDTVMDLETWVWDGLEWNGTWSKHLLQRTNIKDSVSVIADVPYNGLKGYSWENTTGYVANTRNKRRNTIRLNIFCIGIHLYFT